MDVTVNEALRREVSKLLKEKSVELVLGYRKGTLPLRSRPAFVRTGDSAAELIFDFTCENNLVNFLPRLKGKKVGLVVKACDSRALIEHLKEKQFERKDLVLIGVPCAGVIDRKALDDIAGEREITWGRVENETLSFGGEGWQETRGVEEVLHPSCRTCERIPTLYDIGLFDEGHRTSDAAASFSDVDEFEKMTPEERWGYFVKETSKCIRCYACIKVCPGCYCKECFVDRTQPAWVGKTLETSDVVLFHLIRALHLGGRCVDCGACVRACPMGVDLRFLNRKLQKVSVEAFNYLPGTELEAPPLLCAFKDDDPEEFMTGVGTQKCCCEG